MNYIWPVKHPIKANNMEAPAGIYAWSDQSRAIQHATSFDLFYVSIVVVGTVYLWGEVIQHEEGYRAEYAAIRSLDRIFYDGGVPGLLDELRDLYEVGSDETARDMESDTP